jgi:hypothetical protein
MGGSNTKNITKNLNEVITNVVSNSIQSSATVMNQFQNITVKCDDNFWKSYNQCQKNYLDLVGLGKITNEQANDSIKKNCPECSASNIDMKGAINGTITENQFQKAYSSINTELATQLKQKAEQEVGFGRIGDSVSNEINNIVKTVLSQTTNLVNQLNNDVSQKQTILVESGSKAVEFITMDVVNNLIKNTIQDNQDVKNSVTKIATIIDQESKASMGNILKTIFIVIGIILGLLAILGVVLWIIKRNKNKKAGNTTTLAKPANSRIQTTRRRSG